MTELELRVTELEKRVEQLGEALQQLRKDIFKDIVSRQEVSSMANKMWQEIQQLKTTVNHIKNILELK